MTAEPGRVPIPNRNDPDIPSPARGHLGWLAAVRRYIGFVVPANLIWEAAQIPLYTLWSEGTSGEIVFAIVHCTGGDALIAIVSLTAALLMFGNERWPNEGFFSVAAGALVAGLAYTIFSEWLNTEVRGSWAYAEAMPVLPWIGSGFAPLAQWIAIPAAGFWWARRPMNANPRATNARDRERGG